MVVPDIPPLPDDLPDSIPVINTRPANRWEPIGRERDRVLATILGHVKNAQNSSGSRFVIRRWRMNRPKPWAKFLSYAFSILRTATCATMTCGTWRPAAAGGSDSGRPRVRDGGLRHLQGRGIRRLSLRACDISAELLAVLAKFETVEVLNLGGAKVYADEIGVLASMPRLWRVTLPLDIPQKLVDQLNSANALLEMDYEELLDEITGGVYRERQNDPFAPKE